jgi:hypothetical protein
MQVYFKKLILSFLIVSFAQLTSFSQTTPISFSIIPKSDTDFVYTPGRAAEKWHNANVVRVPFKLTYSPRTDIYRRYQWSAFEHGAEGEYDWTDIDRDIKEAIDSSQKFSFGIMTVFDGDSPKNTWFDTGFASYPAYLHTLMKSETNKDWKSDGHVPVPGCDSCLWIPNWNSEYYLNRWGALNRALAQHIATTSYKGVPFADVIQYVDIRGYGNFGEWHTAGFLDDADDSPAGTRITVASQKRIIDSVAVAFPNYPLVVMIAIFDGFATDSVNEYKTIKNDPAIAHYALTQSNAWGKFGWRKDSYGDESPYLSTLIESNPGIYLGVKFDTAILNRYKYAPIVGEPVNGTQMTILPDQVKLYHTNSFGNGNYGEFPPGVTILSAASQDSVRSASKLMGYRIQIDSGRISSNIVRGIPFQVTLHWKNVGLNPPYENWSAGFQLKDTGGAVVWTGSSNMIIKGFQPNSTASITDNLTLPANLPPGNYTLSLIIKDPNGYRKPLPLAITDRNTDGSYDLKSFLITGAVYFTSIPFSNTDLVYTPGRSAEQWHNANQVNIPDPGTNSTRSDVYRRFQWSQFENTTQGVYDWTAFDQEINDAIDSGQKFSFGIMPVFDGAIEVDGHAEFDTGYASYPAYLHTLMQTETNKDWKTDGSGPDPGCDGCMWVPNWNSNYYLNRWGALNRALANHIANTSYSGVAYANAIQYVDIRGYGSYGAWHMAGIIDDVDNSPAGTRVTVASQKRIIDSVAVAFPNYPLVAMIATFESGETFFANIKNDPEIAHYALTQSNAWGKFGWRHEAYGSEESYLSVILEDNPASWSSVQFDTAIMNRYKYAPIVGEPVLGIEMDALPNQVRRYHVNSFGNGPFIELSAASEDSVRLAAKLAGYRIIVDSAIVPDLVKTGVKFPCTLHWKNVGLNPPYENWSAGFQLKNSGGTVVWTASSAMVIKGFQPGAIAVITDSLTLPGNLAAGNYTLSLIIKDPNGYRKPLPLAITGRNADGSYDLKSITVCATISATITAASTCNGEDFVLTLSAATGASPFDLVINGVTYNNRTIGNPITTYSPPANNIWPGPQTVLSFDDPGLELGIKFRSSVSGYIKGVRFYSSSDPDGVYTGRLYDSSGTLLASAVYTNVSANAWQEVLFDEPVPIAAYATYTTSYHTDEGLHAYTNGGLSSPITNGVLTALESVYEESDSPIFPDNPSTTNYWADVIFVKDSYTISLTGITDNNGCTATGSLQTLNVTSEPCEGGGIVKPGTTRPLTPDALKYSLLQSYPNPAHEQARIQYTLPENTAVSLLMFDQHGKLVKVLAKGVKAAGSYTVDVNTARLAKGVYYYTIRTKNFTATKKLVVQ